MTPWPLTPVLRPKRFCRSSQTSWSTLSCSRLLGRSLSSLSLSRLSHRFQPCHLLWEFCLIGFLIHIGWGPLCLSALAYNGTLMEEPLTNAVDASSSPAHVGLLSAVSGKVCQQPASRGHCAASIIIMLLVWYKWNILDYNMKYQSNE